MATVDVMARANLTLQGGIEIRVYDEATLELTDEVQACITQELLVAKGPDGSYPDLGPIGYRPPLRQVGCCGGGRT